MRFYLPEVRGYLNDSLPGGRDVLDWLVDSGMNSKDWTLFHDLDRVGSPICIELKNKEDAEIFILKFSHLTIPEPPKFNDYFDDVLTTSDRIKIKVIQVFVRICEFFLRKLEK